MKAVPASQWLSFPGRERREWRQRRAGGADFQPAEEPRRGEPALYAFAAAECDSLPLWVNSPDREIVDRVLEMELERLGVRLPAGPGRHLAWRMVGQDGPRRLIHAVVIPSATAPETAGREGDWTGFVPAPLLLPPPARSLVLWREAGRWIAGFSTEGAWIHFQNLGPGELGADLLRELQCIQLDLEGRRMLGPVELLTLWLDDGERVRAEIRDEVHRILGLPVCVTPPPPPSSVPAEAGTFLPAEVAAARIRRERSRRWRNGALAACLVGLLAVGAGAVDLTRLRRENVRLRQHLESLEPAASVVREARERWEAMEAAVDVDRYPVEVFHRVASLFPEQGLRMTHFEIRDGGDIVVRGEATSVPVAIGFKADLENAAGLSAYQWTIPAPEIQGETATFLATGAFRFSPEEP